MKHLTKDILDEDEKNTKRDLEHLNQICGHIDAYCEQVEINPLDMTTWQARRQSALDHLSKIAEARKRLGL